MPHDIDARLARFAAANHGIFTTSHARLVGFSDALIAYRLRAGRWLEVHRNVYRLAGAPVTWHSDLLAACWAGGFRAVASHRSAAALWNLPGKSTRVLEITCPRWRRARHDGLVVHESRALSPWHLRIVDGIPATSVEQTLVGIAAGHGDRTVEMALDTALRRELTSADAIDAALHRLARRGRPGIQRLRRVLELHSLANGLTASEAETMLVQVLRSNGLPTPVLQHSIYDGSRFVARPDAAYPALKIAIEYDSYEHHTGRIALVRDSARRNRLIALGWAPITATAADVQSGGIGLAAAIRATARLAS